MIASLIFALNPFPPQAAAALKPKAQVIRFNENVLHRPTKVEALAWAKRAVKREGWSARQYACLASMWGKESSWRWNADQVGGSAYGIPQADPPNKMASVSQDWSYNAATQMRWGIKYIKSRYKTPCQAWATWQFRARHGHGWY